MRELSGHLRRLTGVLESILNDTHTRTRVPKAMKVAPVHDMCTGNIAAPTIDLYKIYGDGAYVGVRCNQQLFVARCTFLRIHLLHIHTSTRFFSVTGKTKPFLEFVTPVLDKHKRGGAMGRDPLEMTQG